MSFRPFELINAITMIFPWMAWLKYRRGRRKNNRLFSILRFHVPISMIYHTLNSVSMGAMITTIFKLLDVACIHLSSLAAARDLMDLYPFPRWQRHACVTTTLPLHVLALGTAIHHDIPAVRFALILCNNCLLFSIKPQCTLRMMSLGMLCFASFSIAHHVEICHGIFHVMLYKVYHDFFAIIERREKRLARRGVGLCSHPLED